MPEGAEIDSDRLREQIDEELDKHSDSFLRRLALMTAILAALAAIASLNAGGTINEALVKKTEATRLQAQASDQWAYYQAKGVKLEVTRSTEAFWTSKGSATPADIVAKEKRYVSEQQDIQKAARELEKKRDELSLEADHLIHLHHGFANSVALFQISVALAAVTALTRAKWIGVASALLGVAGTVLFVLPFVR